MSLSHKERNHTEFPQVIAQMVIALHLEGDGIEKISPRTMASLARSLSTEPNIEGSTTHPKYVMIKESLLS